MSPTQARESELSARSRARWLLARSSSPPQATHPDTPAANATSPRRALSTRVENTTPGSVCLRARAGTAAPDKEVGMGYGIVGLLILVAVVLVLAKVAVAGGILGAIALVLLILV